jgi:hypothetical protein
MQDSTVTPDTATVHYRGTPCRTERTDRFHWTVFVDEHMVATLLHGPTLRWLAFSPDRGHTGYGETPQAALDYLDAAQRRAHREESARARLTPGQLAARYLRQQLHIGPRTRRFHAARDRHEDILEEIEAAVEVHDNSPLRVLWGACCSYRTHIDSGRLAGLVTWYTSQLCPYELCALLGEMADADVTNAGQGETWFTSTLRPELTVDPSGQRVLRHRTTTP